MPHRRPACRLPRAWKPRRKPPAHSFLAHTGAPKDFRGASGALPRPARDNHFQKWAWVDSSRRLQRGRRRVRIGRISTTDLTLTRRFRPGAYFRYIRLLQGVTLRPDREGVSSIVEGRRQRNAPGSRTRVYDSVSGPVPRRRAGADPGPQTEPRQSPERNYPLTPRTYWAVHSVRGASKTRSTVPCSIMVPAPPCIQKTATSSAIRLAWARLWVTTTTV